MLERTSRPGALDTLKQITAEQTAREKLLQWRYPWFNVVYNYLIAVLIIALTCSMYGWALDVWAQNRADTQTRAAVEAYQAEQQALAAKQEQERKEAEKAIDKIIDGEAETVAKAFEGIKLFVENYHYTESDLETYARCMFNRVDAGGGVNSLHVIVSRPEQFTGYSEKNTVQTDYKTIAKKLVTAWHKETEKPCDLRYQYAELTPEGIFLTMEFNAGPYARRWHA